MRIERRSGRREWRQILLSRCHAFASAEHATQSRRPRVSMLGRPGRRVLVLVQGEADTRVLVIFRRPDQSPQPQAPELTRARLLALASSVIQLRPLHATRSDAWVSILHPINRFACQPAQHFGV